MVPRHWFRFVNCGDDRVPFVATAVSPEPEEGNLRGSLRVVCVVSQEKQRQAGNRGELCDVGLVLLIVNEKVSVSRDVYEGLERVYCTP